MRIGLSLLAGLLAGSVAGHAANLPTCRLSRMEIYEQGGDAGLGHGEQTVAVRNISGTACEMEGVPRLEFFDKAGAPVKVNYGRNAPDYMFEQQPVSRVVLEPGGFAHFMISMTTGDQRQKFISMKVVLPGDVQPFMVSAARWVMVDSINVSAVVAGLRPEMDMWKGAPENVVKITSQPMAGWAAELRTAESRGSPFAVHFSLRNMAAKPQRLNVTGCETNEQLTNSAGKYVWNSGRCEAWSGEIDAQGWVPAGGLVTADFDAGEAAEKLCREGRWTDRISIYTRAGVLIPEVIPFQVESTDCSDSEHVGPFVDKSVIRWTLFASHGVRLGVEVVGQNGTALPIEPASIRNHAFKIATVEKGVPIELRIYVDDLSDEPLHFDFGPDAFRVLLAAGGSAETISTSVSGEGGAPGTEVTVTPHSWMYVGTLRLNDKGELTPGQHQLAIAPRFLTGEFAAANAPAEGWPFTSGAATTATFVNVTP
ncbi:MAG TPA: DUF4232 domain-containing protein [Candidatus Aquilonibacter sp.]|nr:DUF4232 domain-containing protein [Candidatus Aquilonibacter sp.]